LLLSYLYGKPTERHEITGKDGGALELATRVIEPGE
jgi:hypothetical protein